MEGSSEALQLDGCTLFYFSIPGRGEAIRLALTIGGVEFTDKRILFPEWGSLKPTTGFGSMPILQLSNGVYLSQQRTILRFIGKLVEPELYPSDPLMAAYVDQLMDAMDNVQTKVKDAGKGMVFGPDQQAARKHLVERGEVFNLLTKVDHFVATHGQEGHSVGRSLTVADLFLASTLSTLISGYFEGVPATALQPFPSLLAVRRMVGNHPVVLKYYQDFDSCDKAKYPKAITEMGKDPNATFYDPTEYAGNE